MEMKMKVQTIAATNCPSSVKRTFSPCFQHCSSIPLKLYQSPKPQRRAFFPTMPTWKSIFFFLLLPTAALILLLLRPHPPPSPIPADHVLVPISTIMTGSPVSLPQDDDRIKSFIYSRGYLTEPSTAPYNLTQPSSDPSIGQGQMIRKLFRNMTGGFFVESGALDGETRSNTLYLEKELGWRGLLIEPDPSNYAMMVEKNRKAFLSNTCLATKPYPHQVQFRPNFNIGRIAEDSAKKDQGNDTDGLLTIQCFPLYSLLHALSLSTVDYFSLDIEGTEMEMLENFPFDRVFIKTLSVEFSHLKTGKESLKRFMESKGYIVVAEVTQMMGLANDYIFVHKSLHQLLAEARKLVGKSTGGAPGSSVKLLATSLKFKKPEGNKN